MKEAVMIFKLPAELREKFRQKCRCNERTMSAQIRMLITHFVQDDAK